ncbi:UNVERIFIED_CONTAM: hypothetical protein RMT77_014730 [Armadillidium vulgare]
MNGIEINVTDFNFVNVKEEQLENEKVVDEDCNQFRVEKEVMLDAEELVIKQEEIELGDVFVESDSDCSVKSHTDFTEVNEKDSLYDIPTSTSTQIIDNEIHPYDCASSERVPIRQNQRNFVTDKRNISTDEPLNKVKERGFGSLGSEYNSFGLYLAASLKNLPLENAISAQLNIMTILRNEKLKAFTGKAQNDSHHHF